MDEEFRRLVTVFERAGNKTGYLQLFTEPELLELANNAIFEYAKRQSEIKFYPTQIDTIVMPVHDPEESDLTTFLRQRDEFIGEHQILLMKEWGGILHFKREAPIIVVYPWEGFFPSPQDPLTHFMRHYQQSRDEGWSTSWFVKDDKIIFTAVTKLI